MSEVNSLYQVDLVFDGDDGEMKGKEIKAFNFLDLIEEIEDFVKNHNSAEVWSALFIYGKEESQIKMKVIETLKRRKGEKNGQ